MGLNRVKCVSIKMPKYVVDKCCGCMELKSGCFIIGYLNLIFNIIFTAVTVISFGAMVYLIHNPKIFKIDADYTFALVTMIVLGIFLVFVLLNLSFAIVLLVGLHQEKPGHLKAYLIYSIIFMVITIFRLIVDRSSFGVDLATVIGSILYILLSIYFLVVIRSQYYVIKSPSRKPAIYTIA